VCLWGIYVLVWGSECVLCVVQFGLGLGERIWVVCGTVLCGFEGLIVCCVWNSLLWVWGSAFVLYLGEFCVGFRD